MAKNNIFTKNQKPATNSSQIAAPANVTKAPEQGPEQLIVNHIVMRSVDRSRKEVGDWRDSHRAAENIYYPNRTRLLDLYSDVELDGHLSGLMMKRVESVLNKKMRFVKDGKEVEDVCKLINTNEFREIKKGIINSLFYGVEGFEFLPSDKLTFKKIPRKHIKPEKKVIAINQTDYDGIAYEDLSNLWIISHDRDLGLLLKCAFYVLLKKGNFSDWANYIEIFGQPMVVTKYDIYDQKTKDQLTSMIDSIGSGMRLSIPKQADLEVMDGKTSNGTGDLQDKFNDACNNELSVLVLGNTETTKSSKSSGYAQSKEHGRQQNEVTKSDTQFVCNLLNTDKFLAILKSYGYDVEGGEFVIEEKMDVNQQKTRAEVLDFLKNKLQLPLDNDSLYEEFGVVKPKDYDQQLAEREEEDDEEDGPNDDDQEDDQDTKKQKSKDVEPAKKMLSDWDRFLDKMANFFGPARKD